MNAVKIADWGISHGSRMICPLLTPDVSGLDHLFYQRAHL